MRTMPPVMRRGNRRTSRQRHSREKNRNSLDCLVHVTPTFPDFLSLQKDRKRTSRNLTINFRGQNTIPISYLNANHQQLHGDHYQRPSDYSTDDCQQASPLLECRARFFHVIDPFHSHPPSDDLHVRQDKNDRGIATDELHHLRRLVPP